MFTFEDEYVTGIIDVSVAAPLSERGRSSHQSRKHC